MQSLDLDVLENALAWQRAGRRTWLVTVTQTFGASPRPPGSLLAMRDDGILVGSVSGGCIEDDRGLPRVRLRPARGVPRAWRAPGATFVDGMPDDAVVSIRPDGHTVILAVSHDPKLDDMALLEALKSEAFHVGAVGSKQTIAGDPVPIGVRAARSLVAGAGNALAVVRPWRKERWSRPRWARRVAAPGIHRDIDTRDDLHDQGRPDRVSRRGAAGTSRPPRRAA